MNRRNLTLAILMIGVTLTFIAMILIITAYERYVKEEIPVVECEKEVWDSTFNITVYHAVPAQTDDTPNITASGFKIRCSVNTPLICAVPQSWIGKYVNFGDTIYIDSVFTNKYVVQDVMNKRYNDSLYIDLLVPVGVINKFKSNVQFLMKHD